MNSDDIGLGLFLGSLLFIGFVAMIGGFLHARKERLLTHAERMKAIEMGQPLLEVTKPNPGVEAAKAAKAFAALEPEVHPQVALARKCFGSIAWVAFWGFVFAAPSSASSKEVAMTIAISTGAIGVTLAICGTILASRVSTTPAAFPSAYKPVSDPDAFDVAGRRG
jgi:hypothetical protein